MSKVRDLPEITTLDDADLLYAVDVSLGPNGGRKITRLNLKTALALSAAEVKTLYESNADTNAFTDAEKALVATITGKLNKAGDSMSGNLDMTGNRILNLGDPVNDSDAANKKYVDDLADAFSWKAAVLDKDLIAPPASPGVGERYIVAAPASGLWFGHDQELAEWTGSIWVFVDPKEGDTVHVTDEDAYYHYHALTNMWERMETKFDHGLLQGLADDDHLQYLNRSGVRPMTGTLDMGANPITNVGTINGVSITAHGTRHNPGGADAISTAAAVGLSASTTNAEGAAGSVARSDHTHAVATGAPVTQNADQANAAGSSSSLSRSDHVHNMPTAAPVSTGTANSQGASTSFAKADHVHNTVVANQEATATVDDTTTSTTDTLLGGMTITPAAGTYLVLFSTSTVNSGNGAERNYFSVYSGGSQVSGTERKVGVGGGAYSLAATQGVVTVNGAQAVEIRWRVIAGTGTAAARKMILVRMG